jgi:hypothetical protein
LTSESWGPAVQFFESVFFLRVSTEGQLPRKSRLFRAPSRAFYSDLFGINSFILFNFLDNKILPTSASRTRINSGGRLVINISGVLNAFPISLRERPPNKFKKKYELSHSIATSNTKVEKVAIADWLIFNPKIL